MGEWSHVLSHIVFSLQWSKGRAMLTCHVQQQLHRSLMTLLLGSSPNSLASELWLLDALLAGALTTPSADHTFTDGLRIILAVVHGRQRLCLPKLCLGLAILLQQVKKALMKLCVLQRHRRAAGVCDAGPICPSNTHSKSQCRLPAHSVSASPP